MYYNDRDEGIVINGCPGLVSDATSGGGNCIVSAELNEFYLNSHHALQVKLVTYVLCITIVCITYYVVVYTEQQHVLFIACLPLLSDHAHL